MDIIFKSCQDLVLSVLRDLKASFRKHPPLKLHISTSKSTKASQVGVDESRFDEAEDCQNHLRARGQFLLNMRAHKNKGV